MNTIAKNLRFQRFLCDMLADPLRSQFPLDAVVEWLQENSSPEEVFRDVAEEEWEAGNGE